MVSSFKLLTVRGIDVRLHITFPLILVWAAFQFGSTSGLLGSALFGVVAITLLFFVVTLHELGHSFAAQYYGLPVKQIILSPIGGVAMLGRLPDKPSQELIIAIAGPAVNVLIALLMYGMIAVLNIPIDYAAGLSSAEAGFSLLGLFSYIFVANIFLAVFNLLPAFPMDGGRILRALLALRLDYAKATRIAATVGRVLAVVMGIYGLIAGNFILMFIATFIFMGAGQETKYAQFKSRLSGYTVEHVYDNSVYTLNPFSTLQQATTMMTFGRQRSFPVVDGDDLIGFLPQSTVIQAARIHRPYTPVSTVMRTDITPVTLSDDLMHVQLRMAEERLDSLPVVAGDRFLGVITQRHIVELDRMLAQQPNTIVQKRTA